MAPFDLKEYARRGAVARVAELNAELADIYRAFPALRKEAVAPPSTRRGRAPRNVDASPSSDEASGRKRKAMTAAQRKAVGERMKKYWAERRAQSAAKKR